MLVAVLLTVGLIVWATTGGDGGSSAGTKQPSPGDQAPPAAARPSESASAASASAESSPAPTVTVTVTATPTVTVTKTKKPELRGQPCRKGSIRVAARTDKKAYGKEAKPVFTIRVVPKKRCWIDPDRLELVVTSGTDQIWSSHDCAGRDHLPRRIGPKHPYKARTTWQRVRSNPAKCGELTEPARPGWYVLAATLGDKESGEAVFRLK